MAIPVNKGFNEHFDFVNTLINQNNACPVCHLPLVYGPPKTNDEGNRTIHDSDFYWCAMQKLMKGGVDNYSNYYGITFDERKEPNVQYCHYVAATMMPEITKPSLYETPVVMGHKFPDDGFYLKPGHYRKASDHCLIKLNMDKLFPDTIPAYRLARFAECFSLTNIKYFLGCKDCNAVHTGHHQLRNIVNTMYGYGWKDEVKGKTSNMNNIYTLLFDSLAEHPGDSVSHIHMTEKRANMWQIELWIHYCSIMFMAQHASHENRTKYLPDHLKYAFHYAHRDMGLCDFYMSQILAAILYCNFDIDVDFIWFHQKFLCQLARWAKKNKLFKDPKYSTHCLWRLVLGELEDPTDKIFPVYKDFSLSISDPSKPSEGTYSIISPHLYWYTNTDYVRFGNFLSERLMKFNDTWLKHIGMIVCTKNQRYRPSVKNYDEVDFTAEKVDIFNNLFRLFNEHCSLEVYKNSRCMAAKTINIDGAPISLYTLFARDPDSDDPWIYLDYMEQVFNQLHPSSTKAQVATSLKNCPAYIQKQYYNMITLTLSRHRVFGLMAKDTPLNKKWDELRKCAFAILKNQREWDQ